MNRYSQYSDEEKPFDFQNFINKFFRRKKLFFFIAIPIFLYSVIGQMTKPFTPIYRATFDIGILKEKPVEGFFSPSREIPTIQIGTVTQRVIASLLSINLAQKVVDNIALYAHVKHGSSDIKVEVDVKKPFSGPLGPFKLKIANGKYSIFKDGQKLGEGGFSKFWVFDEGEQVEDGVLNEYVDLGDVALKIAPLRRIPDGNTYELTIYPTDKMALALRNSLSITVLEADKLEQEGRSSGVPYSGEGTSRRLVTATSIFPGMNLLGILRIGVNWGNPSDALKIAEVLAEQLILEDRSEKSQHFIQSKSFIDSQLTFYQGRLNTLEGDIREFKETRNITDLQASTQALIGQISDLESKRNQLQIEQKILGDLDRYLVTTKEAEADLDFAAALVADEILQNFYSQLLQAEAELKVRLKEYSTGHPKVLEIISQISGLREQMRDEVTKRNSSIKTQIASVSSQIRILQAKLENVPNHEIQLARLGRDRETAEKLYTFFAEKLEETRVYEAGVTSDLRIINPPMLSQGPINSRGRLKGIVLSLIISIMAGSFAVFIAEYIDRTVKDQEMVEEKTGLPVLASIPLVESEGDKKRKQTIAARLGISDIMKYLKGSDKRFPFRRQVKLLNRDMDSPEFEAFRKLSVNLDSLRSKDRHADKKNCRVIYVTSPSPEVGKTFVSTNLGIALGAAGKWVIIVDTDFRKPRGHLTDALKVKRDGGLFEVLRGEARLRDAIIEFNPSSTRSNVLRSSFKKEGVTSSDRMASGSNILIDLMPIGKIPSNPFLYLASEEMAKVIEVLKGTYDYVIIDGVPVLLFAEAAHLANLVDGVLLTARYGKTGIKELENAIGIIRTSKSTNMGVIINGVPQARGSYYYDYYYKHYSKYYKNS